MNHNTVYLCKRSNTKIEKLKLILSNIICINEKALFYFHDMTQSISEGRKRSQFVLTLPILIYVLFLLCWYLCPCTYVLFSESLTENWYNPNKLLSLNKDFYLFIYLYESIIYLATGLESSCLQETTVKPAVTVTFI